MIYESYNLPKQTLRVGMFFMVEEYIEFLSDLKGYINGELTFINSEESRWKDNPQISGDKRFGHHPIGILSNGKNTIEIFFYIIIMNRKRAKNGSAVFKELTGTSY